jgi:hypothetical protein
MAVTKFEIDRSTWLRGERGNSLLRNSKGCCCCLGFYLEACGLPPNVLEGFGTPENVHDVVAVPAEAGWLLHPSEESASVCDSGICLALIDANDNSDDEPHREKTIAELFAKQGIEVVFVSGESKEGT